MAPCRSRCVRVRYGAQYGSLVRAPAFTSRDLVVVDANRHFAEAIVEPSLSSYRPPVVQEHLEGPPHCHPATNEKPFAKHFRQVALVKVVRDRVADGDRGRQKHQGNCKADATASKQSAKPPPRRDGPLTKVLANGVPKTTDLMGRVGRALQVDHQSQRCVGGKIAAPLDDELFGSGVEVAFVKRRRSIALKSCRSSPTRTSMIAYSCGMVSPADAGSGDIDRPREGCSTR
jgi:hypothetical protein